MLVGDKMTKEVYTLSADASVADGLRLMNERDINRLPVVGQNNELLGIVSDMDLRIAEAAGRLSDPVQAVMTKRVTTVSEYTPLEEAALLMRRKALGGLPVVRGDKIVGIITDGDIFDVFSELLGLGEKGVRLTLILNDVRGTLLELLTEINKRQGNVIAIGTAKRGNQRLVVLKVSGIDESAARAAAKVLGVEVADILSEG